MDLPGLKKLGPCRRRCWRIESWECAVRRSALSFGNAKHFRRATRTINCCGKVLSAEKFKAKFSLNARAHFYLGFIMLSYATLPHTHTHTGLCIESNDYTLTFCFSSVCAKLCQAKEIGRSENYKPLISRFALLPLPLSSLSLSLPLPAPTLHVIRIISTNALLMGRTRYAKSNSLAGN